MTIGFICGSLEEGKDGVGDYTRKFAAELTRMGNLVVIAALNDQHVKTPVTYTQHYEGIDLPVLRLPSHFKMAARISLLNIWMNSFKPDWLSLQFVPFSFNKKGLTFLLGKKLKTIFPKVNWHIMFHELWVGMRDGSTVKLKVWGALQKSLIKAMIKTIQPQQIHTQTHLYLSQLQNEGFSAAHLPLFGNIPVPKNDSVNERQPHEIKLLHFGSIYPNTPVKQFAKDIAEYAKNNNVMVILNIIGRSGGEKSQWIDQFRGEGIKVCDLGEKSGREIAGVFSLSDFGISTTAYALIEKSGSVAAMREFGLPVICVAEAWKPSQPFRSKNIADVFEYNGSNINEFFGARHKSPYVINASVVAHLFLNALAQNGIRQQALIS